MPLIRSVVITRSAVPVLLIVSVDGSLTVPLNWLPKGSVVGATEIAGAVPLPDSGTSVIPVLSVMRSVADRAPRADGVNLTRIEVLPWAGTVKLVVDGVKEKSLGLVPRICTFETDSGVL